MRMSFSTPQPADKPKNEATPPRQPSCPACGGFLVDLRGQSRCTRCYFTWCVGCDNAQATTCSASEYD
jgi:hypothetical protein